jgi:flavin reductase (DIM6/NTAB) family NADH-FMN oxidoreductase RutF
MTKNTIRYSDYFAPVIQRMRQEGLLLVTADAAGKPNVMTIGWGAIGSIWGRPTFVVLVKPSR